MDGDGGISVAVCGAGWQSAQNCLSACYSPGAPQITRASGLQSSVIKDVPGAARKPEEQMHLQAHCGRDLGPGGRGEQGDCACAGRGGRSVQRAPKRKIKRRGWSPRLEPDGEMQKMVSASQQALDG